MADQDRNRPSDDWSEPDRDRDGSWGQPARWNEDSARWNDGSAQQWRDQPPGPQPPQQATDHPGAAKPSFLQRLFSPRASRFLASGMPLSLAGSEAGQGLLAKAAEEFGWQVTDTDSQADALLASVPFRGTTGYRAGHVIHGRFDPFSARADQGLPTGEWAFVAFDGVEDSRLGRAVRSCYTAVPTMIELPEIRVLPSRFPTGPARGMAVFPTVDPIFDARFKLLAVNGDAELQTLTTLINDEVRDKLCAGPDLDEIWSSAGHLIVSTGGPHVEESLARHLEVLGAMLRALRADPAQP